MSQQKNKRWSSMSSTLSDMSNSDNANGNSNGNANGSLNTGRSNGQSNGKSNGNSNGNANGNSNGNANGSLNAGNSYGNANGSVIPENSYGSLNTDNPYGNANGSVIPENSYGSLNTENSYGKLNFGNWKHVNTITSSKKSNSNGRNSSTLQTLPQDLYFGNIPANTRLSQLASASSQLNNTNMGNGKNSSTQQTIFKPISVGELHFGSVPANERVSTMLSSPLTTTNTTSLASLNSTDNTSYIDTAYMDNVISSFLPTHIHNVPFSTFYDNSVAFPFKIATDKNIQYDDVKKELKNIIKNLRQDYVTSMDAIVNDNDNAYQQNSLQYALHIFTRLSTIFSRVYVCVIVSELYAKDKLLLPTANDNAQDLKGRIKNLQSKLKDTLPFLLQLEKINDIMSNSNNNSNINKNGL